MISAERLVAHIVRGAILALLAGIVVRRRHRLCVSFVLYLVTILMGNTLVSFWPETFYTYTFWKLKQGVYDVAKMAVAVELAVRAFRAFPGAHPVARLVVGILAVTTTLGIASASGASYRRLWEWEPAILTGTIWLFTGTALLVVWYGLPIHEWQRAIMLGFTPYLLVFVTLINILGRHWDVRTEVGLLDSLAYLALILFWTYAAWRRDSVSAARSSVLGVAA